MKPHYRLHYGLVRDAIVSQLWPVWWATRMFAPNCIVRTGHYPSAFTVAVAIRRGALE